MKALDSHLTQMADRCASDPSRIQYRERVRFERDIFSAARSIAARCCDFQLQSFSAGARLDFDQHCKKHAVDTSSVRCIQDAFEIRAVLALACSGNPYSIAGLVDPFTEGRGEVLRMLSHKIRRFRDQLRELPILDALDSTGSIHT